MVKPTILLGAALLSAASALYIPHEEDPGFVSILPEGSPEENSERVQAAIASQLTEDKGCIGMRRGFKHKGMKMKHNKGMMKHKMRKHREEEEEFDSDSGSDSEDEEHDRKHGPPHPKHRGKHHGPPHPKHGGPDDDEHDRKHVPPPPPPPGHGDDDDDEFDGPPPPPPHHKHGDEEEHDRKHGPPHPKHRGKHHGPPKHKEHKPEEKPTGFIVSQNVESLIPDSYIIVLKDTAPSNALETLLQSVSELSGTVASNFLADNIAHPLLETETKHDITNVYNINDNVFRGFAAKLLPGVAEMISDLPEVAFVEQDSIVKAMNSKEEDQAPWGLARVSHREKLGLSNYNKYLYDSEGGEGVTAYIVDTGIYVDHEDFGGRAVWGKTMPLGDVDEDAHGHGSHCAGTIGGNKYGIAKKAKLVAVKVLGSDGSGSMSDVIGGVEYVVSSHKAEQKSNPKHKGSTANMSLGGGKSPSLDIAVNAATKAGVHFAVAAGNEDQDACNVSPAGAEGAVTVGATNVGDVRAYFSNWGRCVDIFAPGVNILSVGTDSPTSSALMSGTSMASPHIAGLLTYFVSLQPSTDSEYAVRGELTTSELKKHLIAFGTNGVIADLDAASPNILAFNGGAGNISKFWTGDNSGDDKGGLFDHIGDIFSDNVDRALDIIDDVFDNANKVIGGLF